MDELDKLPDSGMLIKDFLPAHRCEFILPSSWCRKGSHLMDKYLVTCPKKRDDDPPPPAPTEEFLKDALAACEASIKGTDCGSLVEEFNYVKACFKDTKLANRCAFNPLLTDKNTIIYIASKSRFSRITPSKLYAGVYTICSNSKCVGWSGPLGPHRCSN